MRKEKEVNKEFSLKEIEIIGINIAFLRESDGLTQKELCQKSGVSRAYLSQIENGRLVVGRETIEKIADALGVDVSVLIDDDYIYRKLQAAKIAAAGYARATSLIAAVAKRRKELNGEWKPDWSCGDKKYFIEYRKEYLYVNHFLSICSGSPFGYFKSSCRAVAIIDEYEDELLWYFTEYLPSIN